MKDCIHLSNKSCAAGLYVGTVSPGICKACPHANKPLTEILKPARVVRVRMRKKGCSTCKPLVISFANEASTNDRKQFIAG